MDREQELLEIYREDPCQTLPNAFWKTAMKMDDSRLSVRRESDGRLSALAVWQESRLMAFWCADPANHPLTPQQISQAPFALVHENCLPVIQNREFSRREAYFRLSHSGQVQKSNPPSGFVFQNVQPEDEVDEVVHLIQTCYRNMNVNNKIVREWLDHPVYDSDLWIWILDETSGEKVGLGIAEFDQRVPEASLEWVQVLPTYQRRGLGKAIVNELLRRTDSMVEFTTVSGKFNNIKRPETLYRRCGFTGSDIWWLLAS